MRTTTNGRDFLDDGSLSLSCLEQKPRKAPADGAFYVDLLRNRVNPGVDDSSYCAAVKGYNLSYHNIAL